MICLNNVLSIPECNSKQSVRMMDLKRWRVLHALTYHKNYDFHDSQLFFLVLPRCGVPTANQRSRSHPLRRVPGLQKLPRHPRRSQPSQLSIPDRVDAMIRNKNKCFLGFFCAQRLSVTATPKQPCEFVGQGFSWSQNAVSDILRCLTFLRDFLRW